MVMPKQSEMEIPLLEVINSLGGSGKPKEIYPLIANKFSQLTQEDFNETLSSGGNKWTNRIQWVRQKLITTGDLINSERGIWTITEQGKGKLGRVSISGISTNIESKTSMVEIYDDYEENFKSLLLDRLYEMTSR